MFTAGLKRVINKCPLGISAVIRRGPPSFGFFNSMKAGKNVMRIRGGVTTNIMIPVKPTENLQTTKALIEEKGDTCDGEVMESKVPE